MEQKPESKKDKKKYCRSVPAKSTDNRCEEKKISPEPKLLKLCLFTLKKHPFFVFFSPIIKTWQQNLDVQWMHFLLDVR